MYMIVIFYTFTIKFVFTRRTLLLYLVVDDEFMYFYNKFSYSSSAVSSFLKAV